MLLNPIQHQAQIVTHTEIATAHAAFSAGGMFDGSLGVTTGNVGNTQTVTLNAKYLGWKVVGLRYIRQSHNSTVKNQGIRYLRLEYMDEGGTWRTHATVQFTWGEYNSLANMLGDPIQPLIINSRRQFKVVATAAWNGPSLQWLEVQFVVGYA